VIETITNSFKYDPFGRRIYKSSSSGTSVYAYDGANLIEETNVAGGAVARYEVTQNVDEPLAMLRSSATSYFQADGLGSITSLSNGAGSVSQTYAYDSFGEQTGSSGSLTNPFQYTARELDPETNLYYYRGRYYDPAVGRFLSEDPLGYDGSDANSYAFVFDSPTNFVDPSGLNGASWSNPFAGVGRNLNFAWNWFWETDNFGDATHVNFHGKDFLYYGPNTAESQDLMRSAGGVYMQLLYKYKYNCQGSPQNSDFPTWAGYAFTAGDPSNTAFQVGAFSFDINDMGDGTVTYTMYNKAGWHSLLGGLNGSLGDHDRQPALPMHKMRQVGGNVRQMFQSRGPKPCGCEK
jgi:RHS repeat-associated protein